MKCIHDESKKEKKRLFTWSLFTEIEQKLNPQERKHSDYTQKHSLIISYKTITSDYCYIYNIKLENNDLNVLLADPSVSFLTGTVHPGPECGFTGVDVSTVFSWRVVLLPVIRLGPQSRSAQPEPAERAELWNPPIKSVHVSGTTGSGQQQFQLIKTSLLVKISITEIKP